MSESRLSTICAVVERCNHHCGGDLFCQAKSRRRMACFATVCGCSCLMQRYTHLVLNLELKCGRVGTNIVEIRRVSHSPTYWWAFLFQIAITQQSHNRSENREEFSGLNFELQFGVRLSVNLLRNLFSRWTDNHRSRDSIESQVYGCSTRTVHQY